MSVTEGTIAAEQGIKPQNKIISITSKKGLGKVVDRTNKDSMRPFLDELRNPTIWPLVVTFAPLEEGVVRYEIVGAFEDYPFEEVLNYFPWVPKYEVLEDDDGNYHRNCEVRYDFEKGTENVDELGRKLNKEREDNAMGEETYGWGEEVPAEVISKQIPEAWQDKFKFPNFDDKFFD